MSTNTIPSLTWAELSAKYCERQEQTPEGLLTILQQQAKKFSPDGWMLLECQMMDSSLIGSLTILPFGPNNTRKIPLEYGEVVSPRGLASDMSACTGILWRKDLP